MTSTGSLQLITSFLGFSLQWTNPTLPVRILDHALFFSAQVVSFLRHTTGQFDREKKKTFQKYNLNPFVFILPIYSKIIWEFYSYYIQAADWEPLVSPLETLPTNAARANQNPVSYGLYREHNVTVILQETGLIPVLFIILHSEDL